MIFLYCCLFVKQNKAWRRYSNYIRYFYYVKLWTLRSTRKWWEVRLFIYFRITYMLFSKLNGGSYAENVGWNLDCTAIAVKTKIVFPVLCDCLFLAILKVLAIFLVVLACVVRTLGNQKAGFSRIAYLGKIIILRATNRVKA